MKRLAYVGPGESRPDADNEGPVPLVGANGTIGAVPAANLSSAAVVIGRVGTAGAVNLVHPPAWISDNALMAMPRADVDVRYLCHVLRVLDLPNEASQTAQPLITQSLVRDMLVPRPPVAAQRAIADFLDIETARIDALITKKRRMIELLDDRFRGEVEARTGAGTPCRVRFVTSLITSGPRGWGDRTGDVGLPFIRSANLDRTSTELNLVDLARVDPGDTAEAARSRVQKGDVVVGITGANTGWVGVVGPEAAGGYISQHVALLRPQGVAPEWLGYSIYSDRAQALLLGRQYGGTKQQLGLSELSNLVIRVPGPEVEQAHLKALAVVRARIKCARSLLSGQVELLQEHRQALITAAVTGEVEVPGVAA